MKQRLKKALGILGTLLMLSYILMVVGGITWEKIIDAKGLELLLNKYVEGRCELVYEFKPGTDGTFCIAVAEDNGQLLMANIEADVLTDVVPMPQFRKVARHLLLDEKGLLQEQELNPVPRNILGREYLYPSWTLEENDGHFSRLSMSIGRSTRDSIEFGTLWVRFVSANETVSEDALFTMEWADGTIEVNGDWETSYEPKRIYPAKA